MVDMAGMVECRLGLVATASVVAGWAEPVAIAGVGATGAGAIGVVVTGMDETGAAAIGTANGVIIMVIVITMMSSSSAASAFHGGGAGAIPIMAMATATRTVITGMAIHTVTVMDTVTTAIVTAMKMATALAANTALPLGREWPSYNGDSPAPAIIADQSMGSWGLRRGGQFELTSRTTGTLTQADPGPPADSSRAI
jgi:hypothetical protein